MSWTTYLPDAAEVDGPAVVGIPGEFAAAAAYFETMRSSADEIVAQFERIESASGVEELQGATAIAFAAVVGDVKGTLEVLPRVSGEAATLLSDHVSQLGELRERSEEGVNSALARARTNWESKETAQQNVEGSLAAIRSHVNEIVWRSSGEMTSYDESRVETLRNLLTSERARLTGLRASLGDALAALEASRQEWIENRAEEERLSNQLDDAINDIRLGDLSDPGRLEQVFGGLVGLVYDIPIIGSIVEAAVNAVQALAAGNFGDFLWHLSEMLDGILTVLGTIALIVAIVGSGPIGWLAVAVIATAAAKMIVDTALYFSATPHYETGEAMSGGRYAFNMVSSALSAATVSLPAGSRFAGRFAFNSNGAISTALGRHTPGVAANYAARPFATVLATASEGLTVYGYANTVTSNLTGGYSLDDAVGDVGGLPFSLITGSVPDGIGFDFSIDLPGTGISLPTPALDLPRPAIVDIAIDVAVPAIGSIDIADAHADMTTVNIPVPHAGLPTISIPVIDVPNFTLPVFDFERITIGG